MSEYPVYDALLKRRSIRRFTDAPVESEKVELLLRAAMSAPSACNLQPWAFIVVDDADALARVKDAAQLGRFNAPLAIVVVGVHSHIPWDGEGWRFDCGAAAQSLMVEAAELGLASVTVGGFDAGKLRKALSIPERDDPIVIIELGYADYEREPCTWYTPDAVYYNAYDESRPRVMRTMKALDDDIKAGIL